MHRRTLLLSAAATAMAGQAFAQTNTTSEPELTEAEKNHANKTAMVGNASLQIADLARRKRTAPR